MTTLPNPDVAHLEVELETTIEQIRQVEKDARSMRERRDRLKAELDRALKFRPDGTNEVPVRLSIPIWTGVTTSEYPSALRHVGLIKNPIGPGSAWGASDGYMLVLTHASNAVPTEDRSYDVTAIKALKKWGGGISSKDGLKIDDAAFQDQGSSFPELKQVTSRLTGPVAGEATFLAGRLLRALKAMVGKGGLESEQMVTLRIRDDLLELESSEALAVCTLSRKGTSPQRALKLRGEE